MWQGYSCIQDIHYHVGAGAVHVVCINQFHLKVQDYIIKTEAKVGIQALYNFLLDANFLMKPFTPFFSK